MLQRSIYRVLCIGDPHFKTNNVHETNTMHKDVQDIILRESPDCVVVMGDVLDKHETINQNPLNRAVNFMNMIHKLVPKLVIIIGNHDRPNNNVFLTDEHPFNMMKNWERTTICDVVVTDNVEDGPNFVYVPYVPAGRFNDALATVDMSSDPSNDKFNKLKLYTTVFAHQEFKGANMETKLSTDGDRWPKEAPMCITGHIHKYQQLYSNLIYVGTPFQQAFGECPDKAISMYTFVKKDDTWRYDSETRHKLNIPTKIELYMTPQDLLSYNPPDNSSIRCHLKCGASEYVNLLKIDHVVKLTRMGVVLKHEECEVVTQMKSSLVEPVYKVSLQERLRKAIALEDYDIKALFNKLFPEQAVPLRSNLPNDSGIKKITLQIPNKSTGFTPTKITLNKPPLIILKPKP